MKQVEVQPLPPLSVAAVGCGRVFERFHLPALRSLPGWTISAAIDSRSRRREWARQELPGAVVVAELANLPPRLTPDAVLICTSPESHFELAAEALRRGAHVLIEKPMVLRLSEAATLVQLASSAGRQIRIGFNRRFRPAYIRLREILSRTPGAQIRSATFDLCSDPLGWQPVSGYLGYADRGGDLLDDIASHQLDLLPWMFNRSVSEVRARWTKGNSSGAHLSIDLRFADGVEAACHAGHQERFIESLEVTLDQEQLLAGPGGLYSTRWGPSGLWRRYANVRSLARGITRRTLGYPSDTAGTFRRQLVAWGKELRSRDAPSASTGADGPAGTRCVALVEACRRSLALQSAWVEPPVTEVEPAGVGA